MKKIIFILLLAPLLVSAQTGTPPVAGLTPQSPFYFIDRLGEALQELLAFSPETKIRLQISFAAERIAEIQIEMKAKEVDAKGLSVAQERLERHLAKASKLVDNEKKKGKDVKEWSKILKEEFEVSKRVLESSYELAKDLLEDEREEVKRALEQAKKSGNTSLEQELRNRLEELEEEKDELESQREEDKEELENAREAFDDDDDHDDEDEEEDEEEEELEDIEDEFDELDLED